MKTDHHEEALRLLHGMGLPGEFAGRALSLPPGLVSCAERLARPRTSWKEKWARKAAFPVFRALSPAGRVRLSDILKKVRGPSPPASLRVEELVWVRAMKELGAQPGEPRRERFRVLLTHDLDWPECYRFLPRLMELEERHGVRSTLFFLMNWGYRPEKSVLLEAADRGFEVALHGLEHDIALAYRSPNRIRDALRRAMELLPLPVKGFRSPALSASAALFSVLEELGFAYDSSLPVFPVYPWAAQTVFPFTLPGGRLMEFPLALQDSYLFRDLRMDGQEALRWTLDLLGQFREWGGTFVFNGHPGILEKHMIFFEGLLEKFAGQRLLARDLTSR